MEAYFFRQIFSFEQSAESKAERGLRGNCLFPATIVLLPEFHYTSPI